MPVIDRGGARPIWFSVIAGGLVAVCILGVLWRFSTLTRHYAIRQLQELPQNTHIRVAGVVTYVDVPGRRVWIQDETGAVPVPLNNDAPHLQPGQTISVEAVNTAAYSPEVGPSSLRLQQVQIGSSAARIKLTQPLPVALAQFPSPEKNGIQIQVSGIVRAFAPDQWGRARISIATTGEESEITVDHPTQDYSKLVNAEIQVTGVPERIVNVQDRTEQRHVWLPSEQALQVAEPAPAQSRLYSIRTLYRDGSNPDKNLGPRGHLVRVRGVAVFTAPDMVVLEDRWGIIDCQTSSAPSIKAGTSVEVEGFPTWDGVRISLARTRVKEIAAQQEDDATEAAGLEQLKTVRAVRGLTPAQAAQALPVQLSGVVTYVDPLWHQLFIQDATGGIYVKYAGRQVITVGTRATLTGLTNAGNFAPIIVSPRIKVEGKGPLPVPVPADPAKASAGLLDSQFVTIEGVVHPMKPGDAAGHPLLTFELYSSLGPVHVTGSSDFPDLEHARRFEDARVRIQGVLGSVYNLRRQLIGYQLLVQETSQIEVLEPGEADPFAAETTPIQDLLRYSPKAHYGHRVKIAGTVTLSSPDFVYVQDETSGVEIRASNSSLHTGERVEVVGYPTLVGRYSPVMTDSIFRSTGGESIVRPKASSAEQILDGHQDSMLVSLDARLLMILDEPGHKLLVMQSGVRTFNAQLNNEDGGVELGHLREGSVLRLTGICVTQADTNKLWNVLERDPTGFSLLMRSPDDVAVLHSASVWTRQTTLILLAVFALLIPTTLTWVAVLRRRVHIQKTELARAAETSQAIRDLLQSMHSVSKEQRFDTKVSVRGSEDVVQLVIGFNRMMAELQLREREKQSAEAKLKHMAMIDELTGLPNRRMLFDRLGQSLARARRQGSRLALLYIDLDGFKLINDNLGHNIGDLLLADVAQRLRCRARAADTLARIGGDEFTLVLDQVESMDDADTAARGLLEALVAPFSIEGNTIRIGASVGISVFPDHGNDASQLLQQADCAMYAAKHNGKNRIVHFGDELGNAARERMTLENELRRAVADGGISVHYQPEFALSTNSIVRFEALARWTHPTLGAISPLMFIPIAEENGLIVPLGAQILEKACREAVEWNRISTSPIQVAVNVSSVQLARKSFVDEVEQTLRVTGLPPNLLQIELTESAALAGIDHTSKAITRLKSMGVSVALDDFGTGYSSLSYLPRLPFDALKIDRSFVSELTVRPDSVAFVQSIVNMGHNLNMRVIMEGIETESELEQVARMGADEAQGYLLGRPMANPLQFIKEAEENQESEASSRLEVGL